LTFQINYLSLVYQKSIAMQKEVLQIKSLLKQQGYKHAQVKSINGDTIVIDNLPLMVDASQIARIACKGEWVYMTQSMTKKK